MKEHLLALGFAGSLWGLASCADQRSTTANTTAADPSRYTYSRDQLNNTGRHDAASQMQAADPAVSVSNGR